MEKSHGRIESRSIEVVEHKFSDWPCIQQIFHIHRERLHNNKHSIEEVYGITSLGAERAGAERILQLNRAHWGIENKLHYVRDVSFNEDHSRVRNKKKAQIMSALRNTTISLIRLMGYSNISEALAIFSENRNSAIKLVRYGRTK